MTRKCLVVLPLSWCCWSISSISIGVEAQIIPDNTLGGESSIVTPIDSLTERIDGGASRGSNLFHSFREFNIQEGNTANFANPAGIQTIFSRVTGTNPSQLFGTLGVLGNANLFFINPNGIIFGPNARLDISGSFIGSTANSIIFPDGSRFSASNPGAVPLLTIDVPIPLGLEFEGEGGGIINSGILETEQNLALIGGTIVSTGSMTAPEVITLLTVSGDVTTTVQFDNKGTYLGQVTQPSIEPSISSENKLVQLVLEGGDATGLTVTPEGQVSVIGTDTVVETGDIVTVGEVKAQDLFGGGSIVIDSNKNIKLSGLVDASSPDVSEVLDVPEYLGNGGDINLLARENIQIESGSVIASDGLLGGNITLESGADILVTNGLINSRSFTTVPESKSGDINIVAQSLFFTDGAQVNAITLGEGKGGSVTVTASKIVELNGMTADELSSSGLFTRTEREGDAGNITVETGQLIVRNGGQIDTGTFGQGNGGNLHITASKLVELDGIAASGVSSSGLFTLTERGGDAGNMTVETEQLFIRNGAQISASTLGQGDGGNLHVTASKLVELNGVAVDGLSTSGLFALTEGEGDAGNMTVETKRLIIRNGGQIVTGTFGRGNGGNLQITASELVEIDGMAVDGLSASILFTATGGEGDAGNITVETRWLIVGNGAQINASTSGQGNGGSLQIIASELVEVNGIATDIDDFNSGLSTATEGEKDAGDMTIETGQLIVRDGGQIATGTFGKGTGGHLTITASESVELFGTDADKTPSGLFATTEGDGDAGNITINTPQLAIEKQARVSSESRGQGIGGDIEILTDNFTLDKGTISAQTASNTGGNIILDIQNLLTLRDESQISTTAGTAQAGGDGGNININAPFIVTNPFENSDITANAFLGNGGNINITTLGIFGLEVRDTLTPFSDITASSAFGIDGDINIDNLGIDPTRGIESLPQEVVNPQVFQGCQVRDGEAISEFYRLGRGGIPSSPDDWLNEAPFGNEGLIPLEILLNKIPQPINWKEVPTDSVAFSCRRSPSQK